MTIQLIDFFYGAQKARFLDQIVRAFSGFQYQTGWRNGTPPQLVAVPCRLGSRDRMVGHILRNNSENTLLAVPLITIDETNFTFKWENYQGNTHIDTRLVQEREIVNGQYTGQKGNSYMVRRIMPLPFEMTVQVDVWTSNMLQKHMLMEQILMMTCPDFDIQNSDNALDWTAKTMVKFEDLNWTSRSLPIGTENEIEVATITYKMNMWLSPPAEVTRQRIVEQIMTNIYGASSSTDVQSVIANVETVQGAPMTTGVTTPDDARIQVSQGVITLLGSDGERTGDDGELYNWADLIQEYGTLRPTQSQLHLRLGGLTDTAGTRDVVGTIQFDGQNPNQLLWQIDPTTLPANDFAPVSGIIDPHRTWPSNGLQSAQAGQRYLLLGDIPANTAAWGSFSASENDIIQYQNGQWFIAFDASQNAQTVYHVVNMLSGSQLRWTGEEWELSIDGEYGPGAWRLYL